MLYEYEKYYQLVGDLKSKQHFDAFKNFCTSHKAAVKRIKRRRTKCQK